MAHEMGLSDCKAPADAIKNAYNRALAEGDKTRDIGGNLGTSEFADAIVRRLS
jgi:isocitrate/isopropylmalate dehydrogenase